VRILISGGFGFVGRNLAKHMTAQGHHVQAVGKEVLNIGNEASVRSVLKAFGPDVLINAAGDKSLVRCEGDGERAMQINAFAPGMLARVCRDMGVKFVHIGSDHVYATPETSYGKSKWCGDCAVRQANPDALIAVTGHVYAADCPWILWLDGELRAGRTVEAWADIWCWPTYARNLGDMILDLINRDAVGVVSCVGGAMYDRVGIFQYYADAFNLNSRLVVPSPDSCPSKLHPRSVELPNMYSGAVGRLLPIEGFEDMVLQKENPATVGAVRGVTEPV
jgi:dTDP-4-dehydrorhamnose reductase